MVKPHDVFFPSEIPARCDLAYKMLCDTGVVLVRCSQWQVPLFSSTLQQANFKVADRHLLVLKHPKRQRYNSRYTQPFNTTFIYIVGYKGTKHYWAPDRDFSWWIFSATTHVGRSSQGPRRP